MALGTSCSHLTLEFLGDMVRSHIAADRESLQRDMPDVAENLPLPEVKARIPEESLVTAVGSTVEFLELKQHGDEFSKALLKRKKCINIVK